MARHECLVCGYVYDESTEGTRWDRLPDGGACPVCAAGKSTTKRPRNSRRSAWLERGSLRSTAAPHKEGGMRTQFEGQWRVWGRRRGGGWGQTLLPVYALMETG